MDRVLLNERWILLHRDPQLREPQRFQIVVEEKEVDDMSSFSKTFYSICCHEWLANVSTVAKEGARSARCDRHDVLSFKVPQKSVLARKRLERALPAESGRGTCSTYQTLCPMSYAAFGRSIFWAALIFAALMNAAARSGSNCVPIPA